MAWRVGFLSFVFLGGCPKPSTDDTTGGTDDTARGTVDSGLDGSLDADGDGFDAVASGGLDCDDTDAEVNPDATEVCDGVDNDCDGTIDNDDAEDASAWYADDDGDGYGDASTTDVACRCGLRPGSRR